MIRRLIILDAALVLLLAFGVAKLRQDWLAFGPAHQVSAIQPQAENLPGLPASAQGGPASGDWTEIPTHNPFSFDRNDIAILAPPPEPPKPVGPKPVLFGTMMLGQGWTAMLASGQTNNRNSRPFRIGESVDGWTVVEIAEKSVVVEANSIRQTLSTNDWVTLQIPRDSSKTTGTAAPPVLSTVNSAPPPPAPVQTPRSTAAAPAGDAGQQPRMCQLQTPWGVITRSCDDPSR